MSKRLNRSRPIQYTEEDGNHYWMSYSDLMSALLLIFALLLMVNIYDNQIAIAEKDQMIEDALGVKTNIIEDLNQSFINSNLDMEIDPQTGAILFSSGVFFDYDSANVSDEGLNSLKSFVPQYIKILLSEKYKNYVSQIIVEGHTDQEGSYLYNLELSQNRSFAVVEKIFSDEFPEFYGQAKLKELITSNGRSFTVPIYDSSGEVDRVKSRRVEFKFQLKDEEMIEEIQELVKNDE